MCKYLMYNYGVWKYGFIVGEQLKNYKERN